MIKNKFCIVGIDNDFDRKIDKKDVVGCAINLRKAKVLANHG